MKFLCKILYLERKKEVDEYIRENYCFYSLTRIKSYFHHVYFQHKKLKNYYSFDLDCIFSSILIDLHKKEQLLEQIVADEKRFKKLAKLYKEFLKADNVTPESSQISIHDNLFSEELVRNIKNRLKTVNVKIKHSLDQYHAVHDNKKLLKTSRSIRPEAAETLKRKMSDLESIIEKSSKSLANFKNRNDLKLYTISPNKVNSTSDIIGNFSEYGSNEPDQLITIPDSASPLKMLKTISSFSDFGVNTGYFVTNYEKYGNFNYGNTNANICNIGSIGNIGTLGNISNSYMDYSKDAIQSPATTKISTKNHSIYLSQFLKKVTKDINYTNKELMKVNKNNENCFDTSTAKEEIRKKRQKSISYYKGNREKKWFQTAILGVNPLIANPKNYNNILNVNSNLPIFERSKKPKKSLSSKNVLVNINSVKSYNEDKSNFNNTNNNTSNTTITFTPKAHDPNSVPSDTLQMSPFKKIDLKPGIKSKFLKTSVNVFKDYEEEDDQENINLLIEEDVIANNYTESENSDEQSKIIKKYRNIIVDQQKNCLAMKRMNFDSENSNSDSENIHNNSLNSSIDNSDISSLNSDLDELILIYDTGFKTSSHFKNLSFDKSMFDKDNDAGLFKIDTSTCGGIETLRIEEKVSECHQSFIDYQDELILRKTDSEYHKNQISINDFDFKLNLNKGGYGRVDLYFKKNTRDIYAIKTVNKAKMKDQNQEFLLENEAFIVGELHNEFLVKCYYIFTDDINYYFVMEFVGGGDLNGLISKYNLDAKIVKLLIAEMAIALNYLHQKDIIHKDIKPANILIDNDVCNYMI